MIQHAWTVLCSRSSIDSESNTLSLFEVVEEVTLDGLITKPGAIPGPFDLVSLWSRARLDSPVEAETRWSLVSPTGKSLMEVAATIDLSQFHRVRARTRLAAVVIDSPGLYWFRGEAREAGAGEWTEVARVPLEVKESPSNKGASS